MFTATTYGDKRLTAEKKHAKKKNGTRSQSPSKQKSHRLRHIRLQGVRNAASGDPTNQCETSVSSRQQVDSSFHVCFLVFRRARDTRRARRPPLDSSATTTSGELAYTTHYATTVVVSAHRDGLTQSELRNLGPQRTCRDCPRQRPRYRHLQVSHKACASSALPWEYRKD